MTFRVCQRYGLAMALPSVSRKTTKERNKKPLTASPNRDSFCPSCLRHARRSCGPVEIVGSSGHEKVPTCGKPGLEDHEDHEERGSKDRAESTCEPHSDLFNDTSRRRRSNCSTNNFQTPSRANLKSKCPFRALHLTPEHRQLRLQWCQDRSMWNVTDRQNVVFSDESRFVLGMNDNRVRV
ncbi:transposable element Tcb2 transposase [Trichonephila clavipes]|nr:transposable element Tcb2 transposase [Trichonephila clavipes]